MEKLKKPLTILNLTGELSSEISEYFSSRNILVIDPLKNSEDHDWTHVMTKDIHDFDFINASYDLIKFDRHIISLSKVNDLQNFTINNGNMIMDDSWFKGPMGGFIMDKYFQGYGGITLGDNYPTFQELGSFNIVNPFNTGEYLDRMVQKAFENGADALTLKSYFDHLVMFIAGLKTKGKAGVPFEVTYGSFEDVFAIQVHFYSEQLEMLDITTSLSSVLSKKAEEYFLNVAVQSADFFDFSYMPHVNKAVVTGLWTKDERIKFENRGLMFSSVNGAIPLAQYQNTDSPSSIIVSGEPIGDFSDRVVIPDYIRSDASKTVVKGSKEEAPGAITVKGSKEQAEEAVTVVSSTEEERSDEPLLIKGDKLLQEVVQTVKGKLEEDKSIVKISGNKLDVDKFAIRVAANIDETTKEKNLKVRALGNKLPETIKTGLFDFAKNLNKAVDDLNDKDLDLFQVEKIPEIIKNELQTPFLPKESEDPVEWALKKLDGPDSPVNSSPEVKVLETKVALLSSENEKLRGQIRTLGSEVRILKDSRNKLAEIQIKAAQAVPEPAIKDDDDSELRKQFQQKLNDQKLLNEQELKKLGGLLERESKIIEEAKQEGMKGRKIQIESMQKQIFFTQELEKAQRQAKTKDLMLVKTKESFTKLIEKREREILDLKAKADQLSKALASGPSSTQAQAIKDLEKQNQNLLKQIDVYKNKVSSLVTNNVGKSDDSFKDEARKLQMMNQQMKNQLEVSKKEVEKLQARTSADFTQMTTLKQEKYKLEQLLKKASQEVKETANNQQNTLNDQELKRLQAHNAILESQVRDYTVKISQLEARLVETSKPQKAIATGDEGSRVKVNQLETSVKKLTQDLIDSRNQLADAKKETNKLRQDKTALQNQLDKLKKEVDKAKSASSKKPGGKAA